MVLRDIFKKKPKEKPAEKIKVGKPVKTELSKVKREKIIDESWRALKAPQVTEKATDLIKKNQYLFKIWPGANKVEVKKAIKNLYKVDVLSVKIINVPPKKRKLGRISGWRKGYKKAIVKIKEGQKIEVLPR